MMGLELFERMDVVNDTYIGEALEDPAVPSKKKHWWPWIVAACMILFIGIVNAFPNVAVAMNNVIGLKELVQVVTFDKSMKACLENEYAQYIGEEQITKDGHHSKVYYVVADASHISVFYETDVPLTGEGIHNFPMITDTEGNLYFSSITANKTDIENLYEVRVEFLDDLEKEGLPDTINFDINYGTPWINGKPSVEYDWIDYPDAVSSYELKLDDKFFVGAKTYDIQQNIELDGEKIWVDELMVYPTQTKLKIHEDPASEKTISQMDVALLDGEGNEYIRKGDGVQYCYDENGGLNGFYILYESGYFVDADGLQMVLKGIQWESTELMNEPVSYEKKSIGSLPENCEMLEMKMEDDNTLILQIKLENTEDVSYSVDVWNEESGDSCDDWEDRDEDGYYIREYRIANYEEGLYKIDITKYEWVRPEKPVAVDIKK